MPLLLLSPREFVSNPEALCWNASVAEAEQYTRWLATSHYENFHVVSVLLPRALHQDFYNVYAFCRWADDLGDEIGDASESLRLLSWWRESLARAFQGEAQHPVFVALQGTIQRRQLPHKLFDDLITAFEQDQIVTRYATKADLLQYCQYSANPVGRLVLGLCGYHDKIRQQLSDATCSGLQLANFWQDVSVDLGKNRIYLPQEILARHGCPEQDVVNRRHTPAFAATMQEAVSWARELFMEGLPLIPMLNRRLAIDIALFSKGGLLVLDKIEQQRYRVLEQRPTISKWERARLLLSTVARVTAYGGIEKVA